MPTGSQLHIHPELLQSKTGDCHALEWKRGRGEAWRTMEVREGPGSPPPGSTEGLAGRADVQQACLSWASLCRPVAGALRADGSAPLFVSLCPELTGSRHTTYKDRNI